MCLLSINAPPSVLAWTGEHATKWCFGCCERTEHKVVAVLDCSGWYGPTYYWLCSKCDQDCTMFGAGKGPRKNVDVIFPWNEACKMVAGQVMKNIERDRKAMENIKSERQKFART